MSQWSRRQNMTACRRMLGRNGQSPATDAFGFRIHRPHPMRRMRFHGDGGRKTSGHLQRVPIQICLAGTGMPVPRCETPIEKMTGADLPSLHLLPLHQTEESAMHTKMRERAWNWNSRLTAIWRGSSISERFKEWAIKYLHELHDKESASRNDIIQLPAERHIGNVCDRLTTW